MVNLNRTANRNYREGSYKKSVIYYDSIYNVEPYFFNNFFIPCTDAFSRKRKIQKQGIEFINYYSNYDSLKSAKVIKPFSVYFNLENASKKSELKKAEQDVLHKLTLLQDTSYYAGIFFAASYFKLSESLHYTKDQKVQWLELLEKQNKLTSSKGFPEVGYVKTYIEFIINYEYYKLNIKKASDCLAISLSEKQIESVGRFWVFGISKQFVNYFQTQQNIINEEVKQGRIDRQLLKYAVQLVVSFPSPKNLDWLKSKYSLEEPFSDFWYVNLQNNWGELPQNDRIMNFIKTNSNSAKWIVLDAWATWCGPCVKELPMLNEMSETFKKNTDWELVFLTFSYRSTALNEFMTKNGYSFPVLEIGNKEVNEMGIRSFPSTFLISNTGKYILLPHGDKKEEMLRVLILKEW